jgi:ribosomal protein S12
MMPIAFIFKDNPSALASIAQIRLLYPNEQVTAFVPSPFTSSEVEVKSHDDLFAPDYRFKLLI